MYISSCVSSLALLPLLLIKIYAFFCIIFFVLFFCSKDIATEGGQDGARSKGWGRVKFATPAGRQRAIQALNQSNVGGRQLEVRLDRQDGGVSMPFNGNNLPFNLAWYRTRYPAR